MINYIKNFRSDRNDFKTVSHKELDSWNPSDFEINGMNELLKDQEYRRLYFDFDDMKTKEELDEVVNWLNELSETFGRVCYAGYTTDESICNDNIAQIDKDLQTKYKYHTISVHAVFPDTCVNNNDLWE